MGEAVCVEGVQRGRGPHGATQRHLPFAGCAWLWFGNSRSQQCISLSNTLEEGAASPVLTEAALLLWLALNSTVESAKRQTTTVPRVDADVCKHLTHLPRIRRLRLGAAETFHGDGPCFYHGNIFTSRGK